MTTLSAVWQRQASPTRGDLRCSRAVPAVPAPSAAPARVRRRRRLHTASAIAGSTTAQDGFRVKTVWDETHEIAAIGARRHHRAHHREGPDAECDAHRAVVGAGAGQGRGDLRRQRDAALRRGYSSATTFRWPRKDVESVRRQLQRGDEGKPARSTTGSASHGWEKVTTPAGTFDAISMQVLMRLDDETFWRFATDVQLHGLVCAGGARRRAARSRACAVPGEKQRQRGRRRDDSHPVRTVRAHLLHAGEWSIAPTGGGRRVVRVPAAARSSSSATPGSACRSAVPARRARGARRRAR